MFKVGNIIKIKSEKRARYDKRTVGQSYIFESITDSKVIVGDKIAILIGINDGCEKTIRLPIVNEIFEIDVNLARKMKLKEIYSKLNKF